MLARLSVPFTVATALQQGNVTIADYADEKMTDVGILAMADRVGYRYDDRYDFVAGDGFPGGEIEIRTRDGRTLTRSQVRAYGHPLEPMTWDGLIEKFKDCAGYAAHPISADALDRAVEGFRNLESVENVGDLFALLG